MSPNPGDGAEEGNDIRRPDVAPRLGKGKNKSIIRCFWEGLGWLGSGSPSSSSSLLLFLSLAASLSSPGQPPSAEGARRAQSPQPPPATSHGRHPRPRENQRLPQNPAQRRGGVFQSGRAALRPEPHHQAADRGQVQDRGGPPARHHPGHDNGHRGCQCPTGREIEGCTGGLLHRYLRHRRGAPYQERGETAHPGQHAV